MSAGPYGSTFCGIKQLAKCFDVRLIKLIRDVIDDEQKHGKTKEPKQSIILQKAQASNNLLVERELL